MDKDMILDTKVAVEKVMIDSKAPEKVDDAFFVIPFRRPYRFEGKDYVSIDLSGLENLTAEDMIAADKYFNRSGNFSVMPEMNMEYVMFIASKATDQPVEFFRGLPTREAVKIKNRVTSFFYGED